VFKHTDNLLNRIYDIINKDEKQTYLIVFGDHGTENSGAHGGGDTNPSTSSFFFIYSN